MEAGLGLLRMIKFKVIKFRRSCEVDSVEGKGGCMPVVRGREVGRKMGMVKRDSGQIADHDLIGAKRTKRLGCC
jgi:hypothetical protein